jgi:phospholipase C
MISPYARRGYVDHSIYGFESILKMIRYRFGLPPLTPRDYYANNIAAAFVWESKPQLDLPSLPNPAHVISTQCAGTPFADSGGAGIDGATLLGTPLLPTLPAPQPARQPHDAYTLYTSGYLERLGFKYKPATAATMYRHPSSLGLPA